jgi:hypothetical protein
MIPKRLMGGVAVDERESAQRRHRLVGTVASERCRQRLAQFFAPFGRTGTAGIFLIWLRTGVKYLCVRLGSGRVGPIWASLPFR